MTYKISYTYKPPQLRRPKKIKCELPASGYIVQTGKDGSQYISVGRDININADIYIKSDAIRRNCMCAVYYRTPYSADNDIRPLIIDGLQIVASIISVSREYAQSLVKMGVVPVLAAKICDNYDSERIADNIDYAMRRKPLNMASYVLGAISRDYANKEAVT